MAKEIAYSRISTKLQNLKAAHPQDVSAKLWRETFKDLINGSEAMRLFDVFAGTLMLLEARNNKYLTWSTKANSANWTAKWLENIFKKYDILSKYGPTTDATGKALHPRTNYHRKVAVAIEQPIEEPIKEAVVEEPTLEELIAQKQQELDALYHQKAVTDAKKALEVILEFAGIPVDKLVELIKLANE